MEQQIKTIRIFISSTFKDMHSERDYLVKYVFPELKERCIKKGLSLVDVDLRWGVTEEEAEQGKVIEIVFDEIENCKPFFIGILGERYGWTPKNYQVPEYEKYDWLRKFEKGHSITALEIYHGVLNKKEMKPRAFFYFRKPGFINSVPKAKQHEVKAESDISVNKLFHLKEDIKDTFSISNIPGHVMEDYLCFYKGLKINLQLVKDSLSAELTEQDIILLEKMAGEDNLIDNNEYELLTEQQKNIIDKYSYVYLDGLEEFGNEVLENVWEAICEEHPDNNIITDPLLIEQAYHQRFMNTRTRLFVGREDILGDIVDYINDTSTRIPLVVMGEPGSGKSALMAVAAQRNRDEVKDTYNIVRFIGASPTSLDINKLVQSVIRETAFHFEIAVDEQRINDIKELYDYFREILYKVSTKGKLNLFFDAVNQLLPQFDPHYLLWLPKHLPENIKIVISSIESEYTRYAGKYEFPFLHIGELSADNCKNIILHTLEEYRKALSEKQIEMLLNKSNATKPLYLKVACEELRVFPSFELINSRIARMPDTIAGLFEQFLERLEADHDPQLVKDTLCLIESSMYGLLESELLELLKPADKEKLPVNIWARFYRNLSPYLMNAGDENEGLLEFFHMQFSQAVQTRYLNNNSNLYYKRLADYGLQKYRQNNGNTINTVLYTGIYLYRAKAENALYKLLRDFFNQIAVLYNIYKGIADNLFDWVVNNIDFEQETILKEVTNKLAKNAVPHQLVIFLNNKGNILKDIGHTNWALDFSKKSLKIMEERITLEPGRSKLKNDLSKSLNCAGVIYTSMGDGLKALTLFEKSLRIMEELVALNPCRTDLKNDLSVCFNNVGQNYISVGKVQKGLELLEKDVEIRKELVILEPGCTDFKRDLSISLRNLGGYSYDFGEKKKSLELFENSVKLLNELIDLEPDRTDNKNNLSYNFNYMGHIYEALGEGQEALKFSEKSLQVSEELVALVPGNTNFKRDLAGSICNVGQIIENMGEAQKAKEYFEKSLKVREELVTLEPGRIDFKNDLSGNFDDLGRIYYDLGEAQKALEFYERSLRIMKELVTLEPDRIDFRSGLSSSFYSMGQIYQGIDEEKKALEFYEQSLKIMKELVALEPGRIDFRQSLSLIFRNVGMMFIRSGEDQIALQFFAKDLKIMDELVAHEPGRTDFSINYAISHWNISLVYNESEKMFWINKVVEIINPLLEKGVQHQQLSQLVNAVNKEVSRLNAINSHQDAEYKKNSNKRTKALEFYQSGDYENAKQLLVELLQVNFEVLSTHMHLARLALITDDLSETAQHTQNAWGQRNEAKNYVVARILWFKVTLAFLGKASTENCISQLKAVLQKEDGFMGWTMNPVLDHIKPKITKYQHALLTALVAAMSDKTDLDKLNDFEKWRNAKPEEII